jgi:hypothetical protein
MFKKNIKCDVKDFDKLDIDSKQRTDMVDVKWK